MIFFFVKKLYLLDLKDIVFMDKFYFMLYYPYS